MGAVWSVEKGKSWWLRSVRALSSGTENGFADSPCADPTALTSNQASLFSPSKGDNRSDHAFRPPLAFRNRRVRRGMEKLSAGTRAVPASLHGKLDHQCFAALLTSVRAWSKRRPRNPAPIFFPPLCRQSDRPPAEFRGSAGFPGEMPAAAIPCVRDQSPKGEEPRAGLQRSSEPDQKGTPIYSFQTWPRQPMISTIS